MVTHFDVIIKLNAIRACFNSSQYLANDIFNKILIPELIKLLKQKKEESFGFMAGFYKEVLVVIDKYSLFNEETWIICSEYYYVLLLLRISFDL